MNKPTKDQRREGDLASKVSKATDQVNAIELLLAGVPALLEDSGDSTRWKESVQKKPDPKAIY
jgi:hypothetical protein